MTRVSRIEKARGQHCVRKMRLFARVALLEGYDDVAEAATAALARLTHGQPLADDDDDDEEDDGDA